MNTYAYRIYKNALNNPVVAGTVAADSMEDATGKIIKANHVKVEHESHYGQDYHRFSMNQSTVGIIVYANPALF